MTIATVGRTIHLRADQAKRSPIRKSHQAQDSIRYKYERRRRRRPKKNRSANPLTSRLAAACCTVPMDTSRTTIPPTLRVLRHRRDCLTPKRDK